MTRANIVLAAEMAQYPGRDLPGWVRPEFQVAAAERYYGEPRQPMRVASKDKEHKMAKGQKRSTREIKKPKASKTTVASPSSVLQPRPEKSPGKSPGK